MTETCTLERYLTKTNKYTYENVKSLLNETVFHIENTEVPLKNTVINLLNKQLIPTERNNLFKRKFFQFVLKTFQKFDITIAIGHSVRKLPTHEVNGYRFCTKMELQTSFRTEL